MASKRTAIRTSLAAAKAEVAARTAPAHATYDSASGVVMCDECGRTFDPATYVNSALHLRKGIASRAAFTHARSCKG